jgi:hypothetical protein
VGSFSSQDKSVDFLQSTQVGCQSSTTTTSSTTQEESTLTSSTELPSRLGRRGYWRCRPVPPRRRLLQRLCGRCLFRSSIGGFRAPLSSRGLALHPRQELFDSGGWATTTSNLPHRVLVAFVALLNGLGRRHLLQARKLRHQHELETSVLDYLTQDGLLLGTWSP